MVKHQGIILQAYIPERKTVSVLDSTLGRIEVRVGTAIQGFFELRAGLLVTYYPQMRQRKYTIDQIELLEIPYECARTDFRFLHQMLELCYYFLPELSPAPAVFKLLHFLLNSPTMLQYSVYKKIIMARFFMHVGMYPEKEILSMADINFLVTHSIEELVYTINADFECRLQTWLLECIRIHPLSKRLKTVAVGHDYDT